RVRFDCLLKFVLIRVNVLMCAMKQHKRELPEDGCLKPLSSSKTSTPCNIMIIKVPDEMKGPGEMTYQLATLDRSKEGIELTGDKYMDKLIPNLPKVRVFNENRSELNDVTDNPTPYFRKRRLKVKKKTEEESGEEESQSLKQKTEDTHKGNFQSLKNKTSIEPNKSHLDINPWIREPWEIQPHGFYPEINPIFSMNSSVSNPVMCNPYVPLNNTSYTNNYNENLRSKRVSSNLNANRRGNWNKRNASMKNRVSETFASPSDIGSFMTDPPPYNNLLCEPSTSTASFNENFDSKLRFQRGNITSGPTFKKKMFPRKNKNNFMETNSYNSNFNRNPRFRYKNNEYESGNCEETSNCNISNNSYENQRGNSEIFDKYQEYTEVTSREDMHVRMRENRTKESPMVKDDFTFPFTNEQFDEKRSGTSSNTSKYTTPYISPGRYKNNYGSFRYSKTSRGNFLTRKPYGQGGQRQYSNRGQYNNRGRYESTLGETR
ncbi:uncharacterized protein TNIN_217751, partial [Trichonephila inaurata madagascariensis]